VPPEASRVLVIGFDPHAVSPVLADAEAVTAAIGAGQARFDAAGVPVDLCLVDLDRSRAMDRIVEQLGAHEYACVVIGGGIRKPEPLLEFFEQVVNLVHRHAPQAAIAFNTNPTNSLDAALRWLPARSV
jgi:hypothetical protein